jgi:hypothetical protein
VKNVPQPALEEGGPLRLVDNINLPAPMLNPPLDKSRWQARCQVNLFDQATARLLQLEAEEGLQKRDLIAAMVLLRVAPLQQRPHLMCYLCGPRDACRTSTNEISMARVNRKYKELTQEKLPETWSAGHWEWGMQPFTLANPPPHVRSWRPFRAFQPLLDLLLCRLILAIFSHLCRC